MLRIAQKSDFENVCALYKSVCDAMNNEGLDQWKWGRYPTESRLMADVEAKRLYLYEYEGKLAAAVVLEAVQEAEYLPLNWLFGVKPGVFHRFAVNPQMQGKGIGKQLMPEMEQTLTDMGCDCMRFDTQWNNYRAIHLYDKVAARRAGIIHWDGEDTDYIAFEKPLTKDCPLLPLKMHPAFRGGTLTPWGGEKLKTKFNKPVQEIPTGESLEISCIPGLESTDDTGVKLPELIEKFGADFAGRYAKKPFPLLLKLIDAKEALSVQIHPDNDYAAANENGKLGKTEAWLILDAPEDGSGELVYGIKPGTTMDELKNACEHGSAVSSLLRKVKVKPGDVCYIPAGCVHAIGAGIVLYEIQQSSDVTYRFYDYDRVGKDGKKRELHIKKALDVTDLSFELSPKHGSDDKICRVLDEKYFSLDLLDTSKGECTLTSLTDFGMLTALTGTVTVKWKSSEGETALSLNAGESIYLPCKCVKLTVSGGGKAALSMPE